MSKKKEYPKYRYRVTIYEVHPTYYEVEATSPILAVEDVIRQVRSDGTSEHIQEGLELMPTIPVYEVESDHDGWEMPNPHCILLKGLYAARAKSTA